MRIGIGLRLLVLSLLLSACGQAVRSLPDPTVPAVPVYVTGHGWHTGLVLPAPQVKQKIKFSGWATKAHYFEFGWGDRGFYQAEHVSLGLALKALFLPTETVLHVVALDYPPQEFFPNSEVRCVCIIETELSAMLAVLQGSFSPKVQILKSDAATGLYGNSRFYPAQGRYHLFNTCNDWTARLLKAGGYPMSMLISTTASGVMSQLPNSGNARCCPHINE